MSRSQSAQRGGAARARRGLFADERGSLFTEYVIVVAFAGLLVAIGMALLGPKEVQSYSSRRAVLYDSRHP